MVSSEAKLREMEEEPLFWNPLFFGVAKIYVKDHEKAWKIYIISGLIAMDIVALVIIILFILGRYSFYE
jgi:hypothetical protein